VSVTRTSLEFHCSTKGCPWPHDEEMHRPWCLAFEYAHSVVPTHQHWPKKGMGGNNPKSKIVSILCSYCHDRIDNGPWGNGVFDIPGVGKVYRIWTYTNQTIFERVLVPSDAAEQTDGSGPELVEGSASSLGAEGDLEEVPALVDYPRLQDSLSAPKAVGAKPDAGSAGDVPAVDVPGPVQAAAAWGTRGRVIAEGEGSQSVTLSFLDPPKVSFSAPRSSLSASTDKPLTWDDWAEFGRCLRDQGELLQRTVTQWCFAVGDWVNEGEDTFGEMAHQLIDDIGLTYWKIATYASVARRVPPENRLCDSHKLTFGHHQAVAVLPAPEQRQRLQEAASASMSVRALREAVSGPVAAPEVHACPECGAEHRRKV